MFTLFLVLRKQARKLENDIDMKLVAYSKIGTSSIPSTSADTAPLLSEHVFDSISMEIEQMLDKVIITSIQLQLFIHLNWKPIFFGAFQLSEINDKMTEIPLTTDSYMIHTLQRHREILNVILIWCNNFLEFESYSLRIFQGYKQEFNKIQANHTTRLEREELLRGSGISMSSGLSRRDMYLKESTHLHG